MSTEPYTPNDEQIREAATRSEFYEDEETFDRWLAKHDDEVKNRVRADYVLTRANIAKIRAEGVRETARYIERLAPNGLVNRAAILGDMEIAAYRLERGIHANGKDRSAIEAGS